MKAVVGIKQEEVAEEDKIMEGRLRVVEGKLKEHASKLSSQQEQLHAISIQLARMQALQEALDAQEEKNFLTNNDQHKELNNKLDDLISAVAEKKGLVRGLIYKILGVSAVVFVLAAASYYFPAVHQIFHQLLEIMQGPHQ